MNSKHYCKAILQNYSFILTLDQVKLGEHGGSYEVAQNVNYSAAMNLAVERVNRENYLGNNIKLRQVYVVYNT